MLNKKFLLSQGRAFYWYPYLQISFYTRMMATEVFFGNYQAEEANIAYSILKSTMKVSIQTKAVAASKRILFPHFTLQ